MCTLLFSVRRYPCLCALNIFPFLFASLSHSISFLPGLFFSVCFGITRSQFLIKCLRKRAIQYTFCAWKQMQKIYFPFFLLLLWLILGFKWAFQNKVWNWCCNVDTVKTKRIFRPNWTNRGRWVDLLLLFLLLRFAATVDKAWNCKIRYTTNMNNGLALLCSLLNTHTHTQLILIISYACRFSVYDMFSFKKYVAPPMDIITLHNKYSINKRHRSEKNWRRRNLRNFHEWRGKKSEEQQQRQQRWS